MHLPPFTALPLTLRASRREKLIPLIVRAMVISVLLILGHHTHLRVLYIIAGIGATVAAWQFIRESPTLRLTAQGFVYRLPFRDCAVFWRDIDTIGVANLGPMGGKLVAWTYLPHHPRPKLAQLAASKWKWHEFLPYTYGMDPEALAEQMRRVKQSAPQDKTQT